MNRENQPSGPDAQDKSVNRLIDAKSPYLLQHAHNPLDWYPWGPEAFEKARAEDKPVLLSIGYSTCHWCHVMAHESFEDPETAALLNEVFVPVKVDREERPDIDNVYMSVCQMLTGNGGWPLTIFLTPDKKPFFAATYIPRENRFGRTGLKEIALRVKSLWNSKRGQVLESADRIVASLQEAPDEDAGGAPDQSILKTAFEQFAERFDAEHGGFGPAPKFPTPHNFLFLLRYWNRTGERRALDMVERTLSAMRLGGVFDQVGYGFHRYSTDRRWLVPHFEKMLYDQALLAMAYTEAFQATKKEQYAQTVGEIFTYLLRDLASPDGGFFSAEDADSEGEEGKFHVWTWDEVHEVLDSEEAAFAVDVFNLQKEGNFTEEATGRRTGASILHRTRTDSEIAAKWNSPEAEVRALVETVQSKLFAARQQRVRPHRDEKILTDWNGLTIAALAKAARVLHEPAYAEAGAAAAHFILDRLRDPDRRLLHSYCNGEAQVRAQLSDYTFLTWGLLELYETTFEVRHLQEALNLTVEMLDNFWDEDAGGLFMTAEDAEPLLVRPKQAYDGAVPSGNSVAALNLIRLARITGNASFEDRADRIVRAFSGTVAKFPSAFTQLLTAVDFGSGPSFEVVLAGDPEAADTKAMLGALRSMYLPRKVVLLRPDGEKTPRIDRLAPFTQNQTSIGGRAAAYVCRGFACETPTTDPAEMLRMLDVKID